MKLLQLIGIIIVIHYNTFANEINFVYPENNSKICSNNFEIVWNGFADEYLLEYKTGLQDEFMLFEQFSSIENKKTVNLSDVFLNKKTSFRLSDINNPENYSVLSNVTINSVPKIIRQSRDVTLCSDEEIVLFVETTGSNLEYKWYKENELIEISDSGILYFKNSDYTHSATYKCIIKSLDCDFEIESEPMTVYIASPTKFISPPENFFWVHKENAHLSAELHINHLPEINNVRIQWFKDSVMHFYDFVKGKFVEVEIRIKLEDGKKYEGAKSQELIVKNMVWGDRAVYWCIAEGLCGIDSTHCYIGDNTHFTITNNLKYFSDCGGGDLTLEVTVEQKIKGDLTYQWYKSGFLIPESNKYIGTKTPRLTIKGLDAIEDNHLFYCVVSMPEFRVRQRSDEFIIEPMMAPSIVIQPQNTVIKDRSNKYLGQTYIDVIVRNPEGCTYTWYRDGKIARPPCYISNYWLGAHPCPPKNLFPPPRPAVPEDVGWYMCKIENKCGVVWSDSAYVSWGFDDISSCEGTDVKLKVDDYGDDVYYKWIKDDMQVSESLRYKNMDSHEISILNLDIEDEGYYYAYTINKTSNDEKYIGRVYLQVKPKPYLMKDFPAELVNEGLYMKQAIVNVTTLGPVLFYRLYIDDIPAEDLQEVRITNIHQRSQHFIIGGYDSNLKPGRYKYYFQNDCGECWSSEMNVINTEYKPGGISLPDSNLISSIRREFERSDVNIYPNPASDYITIQFHPSEGLEPSEGYRVQILDMLGLEVAQTPSSVNNMKNTQTGASELLRINVSHLPAGVYFIKIDCSNGACSTIEKFVKQF